MRTNNRYRREKQFFHCYFFPEIFFSRFYNFFWEKLRKNRGKKFDPKKISKCETNGLEAIKNFSEKLKIFNV